MKTIPTDCQEYLDSLKAAAIPEGGFNEEAVLSAFSEVYKGMHLQVARGIEDFRSQIAASLRNPPQETAQGTVCDAVWNSVWNAVWDAEWGPPQEEGETARKAAREAAQTAAAAREAAWNPARAAVWNASVWDAAKIPRQNTLWDAAMGCMAKVYLRLLPVTWQKAHPHEMASAEALGRAFRDGLGYWTRLGETILLLPFPRVTMRDRRLHSESKPAVEWPDGSGLHYLHGVHFNPTMWKQVMSHSMSFFEIMAIENVEQRTVVMHYCEPNSLLAGMHAELLDTHVKTRPNHSEISYALYRVPRSGLFPEPVYFVLYDDRSESGRRYLSGVPPCCTVAEAMAWKVSSKRHVVTPEEWAAAIPMTHES